MPAAFDVGGSHALARRLEASLYALVCILLLANAWRLLDAIGAPSAAQAAGLRPDRLIVVASFGVLIGLGGLAFRRQRTSDRLAFSIGATVGLMFFARTLGFALVNPTSIAWLMDSDWAQHYSGWAMFRHTPWSWPPGAMPEIWYPIGTSIVYTDSLPLLAFALKPLSPLLPEPFQYIGIWLLTSFVLQGAFGALLIARTSRSPASVLSGASLFVFAPILLNRIGHDTLTAHWLLLAALWLYFRAPRATLRAEAWPWWLLAAAAALVHPYLAAMSLAVQAAFWWKRVRIDATRSWRDALAAFGTSLAITVCLWWLSGAMILSRSDGAGGIDFGKFSFNLLGFINPMSFSDLLPALPSFEAQYEGFAYLGAGLLALGGLAAVDLVHKRRLEGASRDWKPLAVVALALLVFAASTVVTLGSWTLVDVPLKNSPLGIFRASGRFIWVAYYALMLVILRHVLTRFPPAMAAAILAAALLVQMADFSDAHERFARYSLKMQSNRPVVLDDPRWAQLAAGRSHLTFLPPIACGHPAGPYLPFLLFAADHAMTINSGYLARWDLAATQRYCADLHRQLVAGAWRADELYVVGEDWKARFSERAAAARCEQLNGYDVCVVEGTTPVPP
jgi:hypothetical protein